MSKRKFFTLLGISLMATVNVCLTSCGDDPEPTPVTYAWPTWTDTNGKDVRLLSMKREEYPYSETRNYFYTYDQTGHLSSVFGDNVKWTNQNSFTIRDEYEDESYTITASLNNDGFISTLTYEEVENDGDYEKGTLTYTYNTSKQLIRINDVGEWSEDDGEKGKYAFIEDYTWSNGNLTAILYSGTEEFYDDEGERKTYEESGSAAVAYSNQQNPTRQFPYGLADDGIDMSLPELAALGLFGTGPKNLPSDVTLGNSTEPETYFIYTLNNNGTIATEKYYWFYSDYTTNITYNYGDSTDNGDNGGGLNPGGGNNDDDIYKKVPQKQKLSMPHRIHRRHTAGHK